MIDRVRGFRLIAELLAFMIVVLFALTGLALATTAGGSQDDPYQSSTPCGSEARDASACARQLFMSTSRNFLVDRDKHKATLGYLNVVHFDPEYAPAWFNLGV